MTHIRYIHPWPNGSFTYVKKCDREKIGKNLILENVYFIPQLHCNLLSISKLDKSKKL